MSEKRREGGKIWCVVCRGSTLAIYHDYVIATLQMCFSSSYHDYTQTCFLHSVLSELPRLKHGRTKNRKTELREKRRQGVKIWCVVCRGSTLAIYHDYVISTLQMCFSSSVVRNDHLLGVYHDYTQTSFLHSVLSELPRLKHGRTKKRKKLANCPRELYMLSICVLTLVLWAS